MATTNRFINPLSDGGNGTTDATEGTNAAYDSWATWASTEGTASADSDTNPVFVEGLDDAGANHLLLNNFSTNNSFTFTNTSGATGSGAKDQGAGLTSNDTNRTLYLYQDTTLDNVRIKNTDVKIAFQTLTVTNLIVRNCYIYGSIIVDDVNGGTVEFNNCVILDGGQTYGISFNSMGSGNQDVEITSCTIENNIFFNRYRTVVAKSTNFLSDHADWVDKLTGTTIETENCLIARSGGIAAEVDTDTGTSSDGVDFSTDFDSDYVPVSGSDPINAGLGTDDTDILTNDAAGVARDSGSSDTGPFEYVSAGGGFPNINSIGTGYTSVNGITSFTSINGVT